MADVQARGDRPILGITRIEHLEVALATIDLEVTDDPVACLEAPYRASAWHS